MIRGVRAAEAHAKRVKRKQNAGSAGEPAFATVGLVSVLDARLALDVLECGAQHTAHFLGLAGKLVAANFQYSRVGGGILSESQAGCGVEAALAGPDRVQHANDVALITAGEKCAPMEVHGRRGANGNVGDELSGSVCQPKHLVANRRIAIAVTELFGTERVTRLPECRDDEALVLGWERTELV